MCGIVGIKSESPVSHDIYIALFSLQHRGQDACGIITYHEGRFYLKKGLGTVPQLFTEEELKRLKGKVGIGHVRYPTIGKGDPEDAQPFYVNTPYGIALAHNGNILNYHALKEELIKKYSRHINTNCDAEILLNILASELQETGDLFKAVENLMKKVRGSYSCVAYIPEYGLFAFRDPNAIKPLVFGKRGKNFIFASESVAIDVLGYELIRDVKGGEIVLIKEDGKIIEKQLLPENPHHCIFEYIYFARPDSVLDGQTVYEVRFRLGKELAKEVKKMGLQPDVVIPVPDTARCAALALAEELGVKFREGLIKNRYIARTFIMPRDVDKTQQVKFKLNPIKEEIRGKKVLIVDDSIVRGVTSKAIVNLIKNVKPREIYFASSCPPLRYPCYYGIDMQTRAEFIARDKEVEEIRKILGVDALVYQTVEGMLRAAGEGRFCTACFTGDYPVPPKEEEILTIEKDRNY